MSNPNTENLRSNVESFLLPFGIILIITVILSVIGTIFGTIGYTQVNKIVINTTNVTNGEPGPVGPTGPTGPIGPTGFNGSTGPAGSNATLQINSTTYSGFLYGPWAVGNNISYTVTLYKIENLVTFNLMVTDADTSTAYAPVIARSWILMDKTIPTFYRPTTQKIFQVGIIFTNDTVSTPISPGILSIPRIGVSPIFYLDALQPNIYGLGLFDGKWEVGYLGGVSPVSVSYIVA